MKKDESTIYNSVCGLNNLGNTCFFNSVLQNLAQTPYLADLLNENIKSLNSKCTIKHTDDFDSEISDHEDPDLTEDLKISSLSLSDDENKYDDKNENQNSIKVEELNLILKESPGQLTKNLLEIVEKMNNSKTCQNPSSLFSSVCKKVPNFKGFQQQDSHELLRNLLDAVKSEELNRRRSAILEYFKVTKPSSLNEITKKKIKRYGRLSSHTLIDRLFGGHLLSSIVCNECDTCVQRIEPFLDLSLPIMTLKKVEKSFQDQLNSHKTKGRFKSAKKENKNEDIDENLIDPREKKISKHQLKKMKKDAKRARKKNKSTSLSEKEKDEDDENDDNDELSDKIEQVVINEHGKNEQNGLNENLVNEEVTEKSQTAINQIKSLNHYRLMAMQSISKHAKSEACSLESCLTNFTSKELLNDKIICDFCSKKYSKKVYSLAIKQYIICNLPGILTIHIKRFQQFGFRLEKSNIHINFPLILDMSPFTSQMCFNDNGKTKYSLYGLVEHSGRLNSGHYTAYVRPGLRDLKSLHEPNKCNDEDNFLVNHRLCHLNKIFTDFINGKIRETQTDSESRSEEINDKWFYISDSHVSEVSVAKVLKAQAYILFYERIQ